ncbi:hypothetical protein CEXT_201881 [Caerostris extrusa]|uniref:Uncharacterized protein n=1 Tax=Caerostris extrusa TaxID=172846 RepID=A0AAV4T8P4_CAEEX|nr:hypothetical protein CEXT_201881 [Caerostris extrusa]
MPRLVFSCWTLRMTKWSLNIKDGVAAVHCGWFWDSFRAADESIKVIQRGVMCMQEELSHNNRSRDSLMSRGNSGLSLD